MAQTPYTVYTESDNLTPDTATNPTSFTGNLGKLVGNLANRIRAITGKASVLDAPSTNLEAVNTKLSGVSTNAKEVGGIDNGPRVLVDVTVGQINPVLTTNLKGLSTIPSDAKGVFITIDVGIQTALSALVVTSSDSIPSSGLRMRCPSTNPSTTGGAVSLGADGKISILSFSANTTNVNVYVNGWWR